MKPQLQPYLLETEPRGLEVLFLGEISAQRRALDEQTKALGIRITRQPFSDAADAVEAVRPDVLFIDDYGDQSPQDTLTLLRDVRRKFPALKSILYTNEGGMDFFVNAVQHGVRGLMICDQPAPHAVAACIRRVHAGHICIPNEVLIEVLNAFSNQIPVPEPRPVAAPLSPREQEVRALVIRGMTNREIAATLRVTENTVKKYVYEVFNKTGASSRVELVLQALQSTPAA